MSRAIHHRPVGPEDVLRAIAVMDVKIDDSNTLRAMTLLRVARRDRSIVEQAEAHGPRGLGVVPGRTYRHESICSPAAHHLVDRVHAAAHRSERRLEAAGRHRGIGVEPHHALLGRGVAHRGDVVHRMAERDRFECRHRRFDAGQVLEPLVGECPINSAQPIGTLRMSRRRQVIETGGMRHKQRGHGQHLVVCSGKRKCRAWVTPAPHPHR